MKQPSQKFARDLVGLKIFSVFYQPDLAAWELFITNNDKYFTKSQNVAVYFGIKFVQIFN